MGLGMFYYLLLVGTSHYFCISFLSPFLLFKFFGRGLTGRLFSTLTIDLLSSVLLTPFDTQFGLGKGAFSLLDLFRAINLQTGRYPSYARLSFSKLGFAS